MSVVASLTSSSSLSWSAAYLLLLMLPADPESLSELGGVGLRRFDMLPRALGVNCWHTFGACFPDPLVVQPPRLLPVTAGVVKPPAEESASL